MKKIFKLISMCTIFVLSFSLITGCGCDRPLDVKISATVNSLKANSVTVTSIVTKKFREPGDTPCYQKVEDNYVLIENAGGISACYDKYGNAFEKATYQNTDKMQLEKKTISFVDGLYEDETIYEMPKQENYSLIFEFKVYNNTAKNIHIKKLSLNDLLDDQIKEESLKKIDFNVSTIGITSLESVDYYYLTANKTVTFTVTIKGLKNSDASAKIKQLNLNLPLLIK